jgi:tetratricopeptide (TPR) repeat protein
MNRASVALAMAAGLGLVVLPTFTHASGGGGMGGGGMPSGGMGGGGVPDQPEYDPSVEYQKGTADLQAGRYKNAITDFQRVVDSTPRAANAWLYLGMSKSGAGDEKGAEKAYEKSIKLDDTSVQAHRQLALSLVKLKQTDKAGAELAVLKSKAATCGDTCSDAADLKAAIADVTAAMGTPSAANEVASHLSLATPQAGDGAYVRAVSLINEHRWDDALASLDRAEAAIGPHPDILTYKGYVWRHKGDWSRAASFYHAALAIDPNHRGATEYFGELKVLQGDVVGARALLARLDTACAFGCAEAEELRRWIDHGGDPAA